MKEQNQHNVDKNRPELMEALHGVNNVKLVLYNCLCEILRYCVIKVLQSNGSNGKVIIYILN